MPKVMSKVMSKGKDSPPTLPSYVMGEWMRGKGDGQSVENPITGDLIYKISSEGFDFSSILSYARTQGKALRRSTFHERANQITALAKHLNEIKKKYYPLSFMTGATLRDSQIDIDGGITTLFLIASLSRKGLPDNSLGYESGYDELSRQGTFKGKHLLLPKTGVAIFINAFNFPCWGMLEKLACAYIAGMPAIVKPASSTSYVAEAVFRDILETNILLPGSVQMINGTLGNSFDYLNEQDVISFTGSAKTANLLKSHPSIISKSIPFNAEADSLNFAYLSHHAKSSDPEFSACLEEVVRELTIKAGQRCTCIRRIFIPEKLLSSFQFSLQEKLSKIKIGPPEDKETMLGALVSREQKESVLAGIEELAKENKIFYQGKVSQRGAFFPPTLLVADGKGERVHDLEVFGPAATLIPYSIRDEAVQGIIRGRGSLVGSVYSDDVEEIRFLLSEVGSWHGRVNLINRDGVKENPGHGTVMPQMIHGGPGRAGGSEELGGVRGIKHYLQRVAIQGHPQLLAQVTGEWGIFKRNSNSLESDKHPFKKTFEELKVGEGITTHRRTVTETDMINFGCLTWDHFYAHFDVEAAKRSIFKKPVVHGYLVASMAAGLFVDPAEGPVLANIGLRDLNFILPVFPGDSLYVDLICKEKTQKPVKDPSIPPHGEVKWQVMVYNQNHEMVANFVVLTLVKKGNSLKG